MSESETNYVLVTTKHRGVFFGMFKEQNGTTVTLAEAQNCLYWSADCHGFLGLAAKGPTKNCRIGPVVPEITVTDVTAVVACTDEAVKAWKAEPWN